MQIIKLAAGKLIKIRATIDYATGEMDVRVIDNPNAEGCHGAANENLLRDLMEAEIPDYGDIEILDSGLTSVGFAEKNKHRTKPLPVSPLKGPKAPAKPGSLMHNLPLPEEGQLDSAGLGV